MFKHLFASMNDMLSEVASELPSAKGAKRRELQEKLRALKAMSDTYIEEWLLFEERLAKLSQSVGGSLFAADTNDPFDPEFSGKRSDLFIRGQGYYKLNMFDQAIEEFAELIRLYPDFNLARIFLAMSYLRKGETSESYTHFHFLSQLTENLQLRAISFNAMGCIQAQRQNMDKACEFFNLAYRTDPASVQPLIDLGVCCEKKGGLQFDFSSSRS
ncbi:tetratricopeptide repeat protein [Paenibacillus cremeus]|uniref:Tetratricopeptide repeat protein n=1 Tax=Paenibacillus cremeus TaxID=2163881 RepID=A0A559KHQ3_9BACL|nr:tetratricopeptide repeat protein [Paenibacillus cremeus]TVY11651.1 tetratricopeptide repeat protein [Paenibacillus cremeus]